jgi:tetratricopeptide (TPR) repeat protein
MVTKLTRTVVVGVGLLVALPALAQNSKKYDDAVAKAAQQVDKGDTEKALQTAEKLAKEGAEGQLAASLIQAKAGKLEEAAASIAAAKASAASATPEIRARIAAQTARLDLLRGTGKDALNNAREAVELLKNPDTLALLAMAQANFKDPQAITTAEDAVKAAPNSALAHDALGAALSAAGKYAEADAELAKAIELDPKLDSAYLHRAKLLLATGKPAEAEAAARKATEVAPQQGSGFAVLAEAMLAKDPKNPQVANAAINEAQQAAFLSPHSAYVQYTVGRIFDAMGNSAQAAAAYKRTLDLDPSHTPARVAIIQSQIRSGNIDAAMADVKKLAEDNPGDGDAQFLYGQLLIRKEDYAGALEWLERARDLLPNNAEVFALLAQAYQNAGQKDDAITAYKRALELGPKNADDLRAKYALLLAMNKQSDAAIAEIKKIQTPRADTQFILGMVYANAETKKPLEASLAFKKALEADPKYAAAAFQLGRVQIDLKNYGEAIAALEKAVALEPKLACEASFHIVRAHYMMAVDAKSKDLSKAKEALAKASCLPQATTAKLQAAIARAEKGEQVAAVAHDEDDDKPKGPDLGTLVRNLDSPNPDARRGVARQMVALGADAVPYLIAKINTDPDLGVRAAVAKALGAIGAPAMKACAQLAKEIADSGERMVLPVNPAKKISAEEEMKTFSREKELQAACREARAKIGCK